MLVPQLSRATATARIRLTYGWRHQRWCALANPRRFTEFVQHRKLHDRDARLPALADKVAVKQHVVAMLGQDWVIPTYWTGDALPDRPNWPTPFVVKSRHGCNQIAFVHDDTVDWRALQRRTDRWRSTRYGAWLDEWLYGLIPPGLLVEAYVGNDRALPIDYKIFVFGGRAEYIQVHLDRAGRHRWIVFDRRWNRVSAATDDADPAPPASLPAMLEAAQALGRSFDFVRVDLYEIGGRPMFGEMTFYPGSGLHPVEPAALDFAMGDKWRVAAGACAPTRTDPYGDIRPITA